MRPNLENHVTNSADGAVTAVSSKILSCLSILVITGTCLFIVALGLALGLGFGLSGRQSNKGPSLLAPPIVSCTPSSASCGCQSTQPSFTPRIINGQTAVTNSWPWLVYLTMNNIRVCTGFLISPRFVLTAGSCVAQYGYNVSVTLGVNNFQSIYGSVNITNTTVLAAVSLGDIAVVTLGVNITYNPTIQPCCLTSQQSVPSLYQNGVVAGWGETSATAIGTVSPTLQQAVVQVESPYYCGIPATTNDTICAGYGSISTCPIDDGGPLMVNTGNNAWTCVGIINTRSGGCNNPITFTRISSYAIQIQNITGLVF